MQSVASVSACPFEEAILCVSTFWPHVKEVLFEIVIAATVLQSLQAPSLGLVFHALFRCVSKHKGRRPL